VSPGNSLIVVNERGIVIGRVASNDRQRTDSAEVVMQPGPTTVRAHEPLAPLLHRMTRRNVHEMVVTTPEGELLGVIYRR
jgi:CBS domain-containing protein